MLKKIISSLKNDGIVGTLKKVYRFIKIKLKKNKGNIISQVIDVNAFSTVIVFENNFGWNRLMKQRPQQIAEHLPAETLMFYHSHFDEDYPKGKRICRMKDNLVVIDLGYYRDNVLEELIYHTNKFVMVYSTDFIPYDRLKLYEEYHYNVIYEYVDDLNESLSGKEEYLRLKDRHDKLMKDDVIITATSTKLYDNVKQYGVKYLDLITNGGDYEHFRYKPYPVPADLAQVRAKYEKTICYYGALASWFDYDLIKKISKEVNAAVVLIGLDYDKTLDKSGILDLENIFYLGKKTFDELPAYGCNVDVFMIPFVVNDITLATSPVKLFEYMAMEKPIVTTALPECKKYKSVLYSESDEEFIANLKVAFEKTNDEEYKKLVVSEAKSNEWTEKAAELVKFADLCSQMIYSKKVTSVLENEKYDRIVVWRSSFGWNVPLFQRPQHIARQLARKGCLVLYEVTRTTDPEVFDIKKQENCLYLVNFENYLFSRELRNVLKKTDDPKYLQIYSTNWQMSLEELESYLNDSFKLLYEYIDDIDPALSGTEKLPQYVADKYEYAMTHREALVVTTAKELRDDVRSKRGEDNLAFASNGVDYGFFRDLEDGPDLEGHYLKVIENGKINICYYGALAKWFDYDLIKKINATNKYNIILFGVKYDPSYDSSGIGKLKNVYFFGAKEYKILKYYAAKTDVLTIPFVINSITQATSPLKLFEYMALHKPIVTTAMNECKNYSSVLIGESHEDFISKLEEAVKLSSDSKYQALLDKEARDNDWSVKADAILALLKENERSM